MVDVWGLAPTNPFDRAFIREILGDNLHDGGAYMFKTVDPRDGLTKWYVGKSKNLYSRLRSHLGTGKLTSANLETLQAVIIPKGTDADFFKLEADLIDNFEKAKENLANKIKSPGCN